MVDPLVYTIILNTNRRDDTLACLTSLAESTWPRNHVVVLDNSSTDGSVEAIAAAFPEVEIVRLNDNRGYAGNNNVGIALALERGADWIFVLNEDTVLAPDCIAQLVAAGTTEPGTGIVGPLVYHFDEPQIIQSAGGELTPRWEAVHIGQNQPDSGQFATTRPVDWISGCAIMVRREVIEAVGPLDERFFYYWEETDWCLRAREAGWQILHVPAAKLWHKGVQRDYQPSPGVAYYNTRNRLLVMRKHGASPGAWVHVLAQMARTFAAMSLRPRWRPRRAHRNAMWHGSVDFLFRRWGKGPV